MSYTPPTGTAAHASWSGAAAYTPPAGSAAHATWLPVSVDPPAAAVMLRAAIRAPWSRAQANRRVVRNPMPPAATLDTASRAPWGAGRRLASADFCAWLAGATADANTAAPWGEYVARAAADTATSWPAARVADAARRAPWGKYAARTNTRITSIWLPATAADIAALAPWARYAARQGQAWIALTPTARRSDDSTRAPWGSFQRRLDPGWGVITPDNRPPTDVHGTIVTPTLRAYIVLNEISLIRVSNSLALPALALSISADADSWTYQWSATLPAGHLDDVLPASPGAPVELEATVNGWPHRLLVDRIGLDSSFGKPRVQIGGRGIAALLGAPYAASEARDNTAGSRTAAQLCDDALLINGVAASGWAIDWNLIDWLVPAGAWVTLGTPMDAIAAIAEAGGGYVRADPTAKTLHIEPRYPVAPWDWATATPDFELPAAATTKVGIEWRDNPAHNAVYVAGTGPGAILARVKRAGTAGDSVAPMVTDPLTTHADAARQRGTAILGAAGSGQSLTLETPIIEAIGPYPVGSLLKFVDGSAERLGIVRGCRISVGMPTVRQTLEVECHD